MRYRLWSVLCVLICLFSGNAWAQERGSYFGLGASYLANFGSAQPRLLFPSFQVGGPISDTLELRGTLETRLIISNLGFDILYPVKLRDATAQLYLGGGANASFFAYVPVSFELRMTLGGEYLFESSGSSLPLGLFGETRIYSRGLLNGSPGLEGRVGLNLPL